MATRKVQNPLTGKMVEADVVNIVNLTDSTIRVSLEDGSEIRFKTDIIEVARIPGHWDNEGHPMYSVRSGTSMVVLDSPDELKKPDDGSGV